MTFDFKKEYKQFYMPKNRPEIIEVPPMQYVAVEGKGNPNEENGEYAAALSMLYGVSWTIKMSCKSGHGIDGFFEFTVPPLEGLWWLDGLQGEIDYMRKSDFRWISMIRLPEFVTPEVFGWALSEVEKKKGIETGKARLIPLHEGLCVQCMHIGPYDNEPATIAAMHAFAEDSGYAMDISAERRHHEIYLGDPRKTLPENLKTVIRLPVKKL